jgi:hypothetical protein
MRDVPQIQNCKLDPFGMPAKMDERCDAAGAQGDLDKQAIVTIPPYFLSIGRAYLLNDGTRLSATEKEPYRSLHKCVVLTIDIVDDSIFVLGFAVATSLMRESKTIKV